MTQKHPLPCRFLPGAVLALGLIMAGPALACLVCIPLPERTLADRVVEDAVLALARPESGDPFTYTAQEYLRDASVDAPGDLARPIPFLVDSAARRRIEADPGVFALVSRATPGTDWELLGVMSPEMVVLVRDIVERSQTWADHAASADRFAYLRPAMPAPIRRSERWPSPRSPAFPDARIRTLAPQLTRAEIVRVLRDPTMFEWAPIHILILGLSTADEDRAFVRSAFDAAARSPSATSLGAWATAYLEGDGAAALDRIEADFIDDPDRPKDQMAEILRALSTFAAVSEPALRDRITGLFGMLATRRPDLAADAAQELANVGDWSFAGLFEALLAEGAFRSPVEEFAVIFYIEQARDAGAL